LHLEFSERIFQEIEEKIEKTFPLSLNEIYWDYLVGEKDNFGENKIVYVVAERNKVDSLICGLKINGIEPIAIDSGNLSAGRVLLPQFPSKGRAGVLDIGAYTTTFNIFDKKGFLEFSISIPLGGYHFQSKIADSLKLSPKEAEKEMMEKGFREKAVREILEKEGEKIIQEIKEAGRYYEELFKEKITKIILAGGNASLPAIDWFFRKHFLGIEIKIANPFAEIKGKSSLSLKEALLFTNAIGLAQRGISKDPVKVGINLLPEAIERKMKKARKRFILKKKTSLLTKIILGFLALLGIFFLFSFFLYLFLK
jgi:Tfp pilus assembly PilM family ATPase